MNKNTGIVLNSLATAVAVSLHNATSSAMRKAHKSFSSIGEISIIVMAPNDVRNLKDIPIVGMSNLDILQTFIVEEGQNTNGCVVFSEVEFIHEDRSSTVLSALSNVCYDAKVAIWSVKLIDVTIDDISYLVSFDKHNNVIGKIITKPSNKSFCSCLTSSCQNDSRDAVLVT